ncbi:MAG: competence/damage-inducible protein A [Candidatus Omnitrophica bacterium]|nr:competence/damage-inducible protein A [Candidatus Omnitrophota bacterium]
MQAEIISIGTELLLGKTVNTNTVYLSRILVSLGIDLFYHTTVGDNRTRLFTVLKRAMRRSDIVIATGGLGPTVDDITLEIIAQATQKKLNLNPVVLREIKKHFQDRQIPMPKANIRQALIPEGTRVLKNEVGTAPGLIIPCNEKKVLIALPGVPAEMEPMVQRDLSPYLAKNFSGNWVIVSRIIRITGLAESQVNQKVKDLLKSKPPLTVGIYAHTDNIELNITAKAESKSKAEKLIASLERKIHKRLKKYIYGTNQQTLEQIIAAVFSKKKMSLAVAESCTGGLISQRLTNISGSSKYFTLGIVAYSNQTKQSLLGIPAQTLTQYGAVSKEVAVLLAKNVRQLAKTDLGLGVTGIAGPTGTTKDKPVGLAHIALAAPRKILYQEFHFHGARAAVRQRASQAALDMLRRYFAKQI